MNAHSVLLTINQAIATNNENWKTRTQPNSTIREKKVSRNLIFLLLVIYLLSWFYASLFLGHPLLGISIFIGFVKLIFPKSPANFFYFLFIIFFFYCNLWIQIYTNIFFRLKYILIHVFFVFFFLILILLSCFVYL